MQIAYLIWKKHGQSFLFSEKYKEQSNAKNMTNNTALKDNLSCNLLKVSVFSTFNFPHLFNQFIHKKMSYFYPFSEQVNEYFDASRFCFTNLNLNRNHQSITHKNTSKQCSTFLLLSLSAHYLLKFPLAKPFFLLPETLFLCYQQHPPSANVPKLQGVFKYKKKLRNEFSTRSMKIEATEIQGEIAQLLAHSVQFFRTLTQLF